jgi:hypothetical protein
LDCFYLFPPAAPGVIQIKPLRGFKEKKKLVNIIRVIFTGMVNDTEKCIGLKNKSKKMRAGPIPALPYYLKGEL